MKFFQVFAGFMLLMGILFLALGAGVYWFHKAWIDAMLCGIMAMLCGMLSLQGARKLEQQKQFEHSEEVVA